MKINCTNFCLFIIQRYDLLRHDSQFLPKFLVNIIQIFDERLSAMVSFFFENYWIDVTFKK
jgi:hypothetical protein